MPVGGLLNLRDQLLIPDKRIFFILVVFLFCCQTARQQARLFEIRQAAAPILFRLLIIPASEPFDIVRVRFALASPGGPAGTKRFIVLKQAFHQNAHTPAVHDDMMIAPDEIQLLLTESEHRRFKENILRQMKALLLHAAFIAFNIFGLARFI